MSRGDRYAVLLCVVGLACRALAPHRDCASDAKAFREQRFADLRGLPAACRLDVVETALGVRVHPGSGWLGESQRQVSLGMAVVPGFTDPIKVWCDRDVLLMLDAEYPEPRGGWPALAAALGPPEAKLDHRWGVVNVIGGEWVYPARGLSVFLTPAFDKVVRIAAFAPTSLATYRRSLRPSSRLEEFRLPARGDR